MKLRLKEFDTKEAAERWCDGLIQGVYVDRDQQIIAVSDLCTADFVDAKNVEITVEDE